MDQKEQKRVQRYINAMMEQRNAAQNAVVELQAQNQELREQVAELQQQIAALKAAAPPPVAPPTTEEKKG